jgi:hypothetical protein
MDINAKAGPWALSARVIELERQHGSLRAAARFLECNPAYLYRLKIGCKTNPSDRMLRKLGLRRVVIYEHEP